MKKFRNYSIKSLYPLALAEGEGVGTAYEYFTKRLLLARWLNHEDKPERILIAGLPEKYGVSLDFLLLATELNASVTIIDERPQIIEKAKEAFSLAQNAGCLGKLQPEYLLADHMPAMNEISDRFDLVLSSETLQRLPVNDRQRYVQRLLQLAPMAAIFTPNNDNPAHTNLSGLSGLQLVELEQLAAACLASSQDSNQNALRTGYIDMPPFPPGITRTDEQREDATSGIGEAVAMWGLGYYARSEKWLPANMRRRKSHIVFALLGNSQR